MSKTPKNSRAKNLVSRAFAIEQDIPNKPSNNAALEAAISSAELYMQALKLVDNATERQRLDLKCKELLAKAESIKAAQDGKPTMAKAYPGDMKQPKSMRKLTTRENIIILEGSKLNGAIFKPWAQAPTAADFELNPGEELYLEQPHLPLSPSQQRSFAGWQRPKEALHMIQLRKNGNLLPSDPTMVRAGKIDLVQDMTSDCSVVASLCAGTARAERGHPRILGSILYPYDYETDQIVLSPNGKYILRLYFNGCWRRVEIDDLLPTSSNSRVLHVIDRSHPGLLWPALVEKAYLKVRGGYDFPGSNSGTDLAVMTGWIPQQVFLHDEDVDTNELWDELYKAFEKGDMLLTIGTGKLPRKEQKQLGLAAEHDYAVLELKTTADLKEMLIKNPWSDGDVWFGAVKRRPNPPNEEMATLEQHEQPQIGDDDVEMMPGTFWMEFNTVFHYFENMYINWNPGSFTHRQDMHITWMVQETLHAPNVFVDNPQFLVRASASGYIWLWLNRHFRTGDYTHTNSGKNGYISLYLFVQNGTKMLSSEGATMRSHFVDSPNTLLKVKATANIAYTVVVVSQDLPKGKHNFTFSTFANSTISLEEAPSRHASQTSLSAAWTRSTAGGNSDCIRYLDNPQFNFPVQMDDTQVALVLRITFDPASQPGDETNVHVKFLVVNNPSGRRITKLRPRDIVASSGDYRRGSAIIETTMSRSNYTVICSTFEPNQLAKFQIDLHTAIATTLSAIPAESAGRLSIVSLPTKFPDNVSKVFAPLRIPRMTRAIFIARPAQQHSGSQSSSDFSYQLSLRQGHGLYAKVVASSADETNEFSNLISGPRIEDQHLDPRSCSPEEGGLWLVLERPAGQTSNNFGHSGTVLIEVEILADERVEIGRWEFSDD